MKLPPFVLPLSLSCALIAAIVGLIVQQNAIAQLRTVGGSAVRHGTIRTENADGPGGAVHAGGQAGPRTTWAALKGENGEALVRNLRAAGFSPYLVQAIVTASVRESFLPRYRAASPAGSGDWEYWKFGVSRYDPNLQTPIRALAREEAALVKQLLGAGNIASDGHFAELNARAYGRISPEKIDQIKRINEDYAELLYEAREATKGLKIAADEEKIAYLEKEQRADLAKILTPAELEAYELRSSPTAQQLRTKLLGFDPTEDEFRLIFSRQREFDEKFSRVPATDAERVRAETALQVSLKSALGDERYEAYKTASDPLHQLASRVAVRLQLPPKAAAEVFAVQQQYVTEYKALGADPKLTTAQRYDALGRAYDQANTKIVRIFGPSGTDLYRHAANGWLTPPKPPPTKSK